MPSRKRKFGDLGEDIAKKWLEKRRYKILDRNYLKKWGEIDIVAKKGSELFFVEVKTISCINLGKDYIDNLAFRPEDNVHPRKLQRLARTVETYLAEKSWQGEWRISVMAVYLNKEARQAKVRFLESVI